MGDLVRYDVDGRVGTVSLNRPDRRNGLTPELAQDLRAALDEATGDDTLAVVLRGEGTHFCVGGDLHGGGTARYGDDPATAAQMLAFSGGNATRLHTMPKITIAAVQGAAAGAGLVLAMACDLRVAEASAVFRSAFLSAALPGDYGGSYHATRLLGAARARELYLLNDKVDAEEARRIGLVSRVVADGTSTDEAVALAKQLAAHAPNALRSMKANLVDAETSDLDTMVALESERQGRQILSADAKEAARAFLEKRDRKSVV